jgi:hypothetical protein
MITQEAAEQSKSLRSSGSGALDWRLERARAPFVDHSKAINQEVVGNVWPALVWAGVHPINLSEGCKRLALGIAIRGDCVVHEQEANITRRFALEWPQNGEVSTPDRTRNNLGSANAARLRIQQQTSAVGLWFL